MMSTPIKASTTTPGRCPPIHLCIHNISQAAFVPLILVSCRICMHSVRYREKLRFKKVLSRQLFVCVVLFLHCPQSFVKSVQAEIYCQTMSAWSFQCEAVLLPSSIMGHVTSVSGRAPLPQRRMKN